MTAVAIQVRPAVLRRARDIAARNLPRPKHLREHLGWDVDARIRAREATVEDIKRLCAVGLLGQWDGLLHAADAAIRDGVPVGKKRARCHDCGTGRLVGVGLRGDFVADYQRRTARLRCGGCERTTTHTLLEDHDPMALHRARSREDLRLARETLPAEVARLRALGVSIQVTDSRYADGRLLRAADGTLLVRYCDTLDSRWVAMRLGVIRLAVEAGLPDFVRWEPWRDGAQIANI